MHAINTLGERKQTSDFFIGIVILIILWTVGTDSVITLNICESLHLQSLIEMLKDKILFSLIKSFIQVGVQFNREKVIEGDSPLFAYMRVLHTVISNRLH